MPRRSLRKLVVLPVAFLVAIASVLTVAATSPPSISGLNPRLGPTAGGTRVAIFGFNLTGTTAVHFGANPGTSILVRTANQVLVTDPAGAAATVHVTVTTPAGTSAIDTTDLFTYSDQPAISFLGPSSGRTAGGTRVQIIGTNLAGTTAVHFGVNLGTAIAIVSSSQVNVTSPAGAAGNVHVTVTTAKGTSSISPSDIYAYSDQPTIQFIGPNSGPTAGSTRVSILGTNLSGTAAIHFGAKLGIGIVNVSPIEVDVSSPPGAAGSVDVIVTTTKGTSSITGSDVFTYSDQPTVFNLFPSIGPTAGGTRVSILGTSFAGATAVHFGANLGTGISVVNSGEVDATSPAGAAGDTVVTVTTAKGTSTFSGSGDVFTYSDQPSVSGLFPSVGLTAGGTRVHISGSGLSGTTAVHFGANLGTAITNVSFSEVDVTSPAGAAGNVDVTVTTAKGTTSISPSDIFTYSDLPAINFLSPNLGPTAGGTRVQIFGTNLSGTTAVHFGANLGTAITNVSSGQVSVTSPAGAAGSLHVTLTTAKGTSSISFGDVFTYSDQPTISFLNPNTGPNAGGTRVQIFGTNLTGTTAVHFGANLGTAITNVSAGEVDATSPAGAAGNVGVTVTTAKGTSSLSNFSSGDIFTYLSNQPTVQSVGPSSGPTAGGTRVQIFGTNLSGTTAVHFGANLGTALTNVSVGEVDATSPAGAAGNVHVTVTTAIGISSIGFSDLFTYSDQPTFFSPNPSTGPTVGGTRVVINGTNLSGTTAVHFGANLGTAITNMSSTEVDVTSPAGAAGTVDVTVTTAAGTSAISPTDIFTYSDQPAISSMSPNAGVAAGGTRVMIFGTNLSGTTAVHFGANLGTSINNVSSGEVDVTAPAGAAGQVDVTVTTASGTSSITGGDVYTYS